MQIAINKNNKLGLLHKGLLACCNPFNNTSLINPISAVQLQLFAKRKPMMKMRVLWRNGLIKIHHREIQTKTINTGFRWQRIAVCESLVWVRRFQLFLKKCRHRFQTRESFSCLKILRFSLGDVSTTKHFSVEPSQENYMLRITMSWNFKIASWCVLQICKHSVVTFRCLNIIVWQHHLGFISSALFLNVNNPTLNYR